MRRKAAMSQLQKPAKQTKKKTAGKDMKGKKNDEKENEDKITKERDQQAKKVNKEEMAKKKAERQKKQAEKEKAKEEKAREKAQKEKERTALVERDNRVLSKMATFASNLRSTEECELGSELLLSEEEDPVILEQDLDDCFNGNDIVSVLSDEYLNDTPSNPTFFRTESRASHLDQSATNVVNAPTPTLVLHPPRASSYLAPPALALHSTSSQASTCSSRQPSQPRQLPVVYENRDTHQTPRSTVAGKRPHSWNNLNVQPEAARPAVGGKRPRASFQPLSEGDTTCVKCNEFKELIFRKDAEIAQLRAPGNKNHLDMIIAQVGLENKK